jgi:predicted RecB family nuclease
MRMGSPLVVSTEQETGDPVLNQRILDYNEDDCPATTVLLDGIMAMA